MLFSYNWLKDYINGDLPAPKKLAELLTQYSFEVESVDPVRSDTSNGARAHRTSNGVEKKGRDWVLDIDVLPNRAHDCLSYIGIAREISVITNKKFQIPVCKLKESKENKTENFIRLEIKNKNDCPRYTGRIIFGLKVKDSLIWMQGRLKACGLQPINSIVDIMNYVMLETGQPLHAFDLDKISGVQNKKLKIKKIIVRRAKKGEKIIALDEERYDLDEDILVIADSKEPLCIAGIKGGRKAEIDKKTKNIFIEAANFNQKIIRNASKKIKLKTDASWRFENGIDPNLIDWAQQRACSLIQDISEGEIAQGRIDFYPQKVRPKKIQLDLDYVKRLLGIDIPENKIKNLLEKLEFKVKKAGSKQLGIEAPTRRLDISLQEDLIEEIGRILGYQNIPSVYPQIALIPPHKNESVFWQKICQDILKELGFSEVYNYSFIGEREKEVFNLSKKELIELENPISSLNKYLRPNLLVSLIKNIKENLKYFEEIKVFEFGKIFRGKQSDSKDGEIKEKAMLSGVLTRKKIDDEGFYELKGVIDSLFNKLAISDIFYDDFEPTSKESKIEFWHPKKCAEIKVNREEVGFLGELHPKILGELNIKEKIFAFDLDFEKIVKLASEEHQYQPISSYPAAIRDLAILVPLETKVVDILNRINNAGGKLVCDVDLFDIYKGKEIPGDKQNFAFHIVYQSENKTLSSKEVDAIHQKIVKSLEENPRWKVRK